MLHEQLGSRRLRLNDDQRRRLAVRAKKLGRRVLHELATIVTPETLLAWHRKLIARKYDGSKQRGPGRPRTQDEIQQGWSAWPLRTAIGATGEYKGRWTIWGIKSAGVLLPTSLRSTVWNRRRTQAEDHLERVPNPASGGDCSGGLFHGRGLDSGRLDKVPGAVPNRPVHSTGGDSRTGQAGKWALDEPGCTTISMMPRKAS